MSVFRINKTSDYTVMSNYHLREKNMSLKAKGLLSIMLSLPNDWDYSINGLATLSKDGKDSVMGALNELEEFGYLVRSRTINEKGQFLGYDYDIYENPYTENPNTVKPNTEKPTQLNTKRTNVDKEITNILKEYNFSFEIEEKINEWLTYKKEKKQSYKPTGFKTLLKNIQNAIYEIGEQAVLDSIDNCIASNYSGLFFNKKNKSNNAIVSQSKKQNDQFLDWCAEAYEILEGQ